MGRNKKAAIDYINVKLTAYASHSFPYRFISQQGLHYMANE